MSSVVKSAFCPRCQTDVKGDSKHWPFCSEICQNCDLYHWLSEDYSISRDLNENELGEWFRIRGEQLNPYDPDAF